MKNQKMILLAVAIVAMLLAINPQVMAVTCSVTYVDGNSTGECSPPTWTITQATLNVVPSPPCPWCVCYRAETDKPFAFSLKCTITLPQVGLIHTDPGTGQTGLFDQMFHNTTKTHEDWHYAYACALADATYGALERWSASYFSDCCLTTATALALGTSDMANALQAAQNAFNTHWPDDVPIETAAGSCWYIADVNGVATYRSQNPDWGQAAVDHAKSIVVNFTKGDGDCPCIVPEPATVLLLGFGGLVLLRKRNGETD